MMYIFNLQENILPRLPSKNIFSNDKTKRKNML